LSPYFYAMDHFTGLSAIKALLLLHVEEWVVTACSFVPMLLC